MSSSEEDESITMTRAYTGALGVWSDVADKVGAQVVGVGNPAGSERAKKIERDAAEEIYNYIKRAAKRKGQGYSEQVGHVVRWMKENWYYGDAEIKTACKNVGSYLEMIENTEKIQKRFRGNQSRLQSKAVGRITRKQKEKDWPSLKKELEEAEMETWTNATKGEKDELKRKLDEEIENFKDHYMASKKSKKKNKKKTKKKKKKTKKKTKKMKKK